MPKLTTCLLITALLLPGSTLAAAANLPTCGSIDPFRLFADKDDGPRPCPLRSDRRYTPRHAGLGHELLDLESAVCFVPDESYALLDDIIDDAEVAIRPLLAATGGAITRDFAIQASSRIGALLTARGFRFHVPTVTLGDALAPRNPPGKPARHRIDCDTSGFIYLTIAETLRLPLSLVEITMPNGNGHAYLRWALDDQTYLEWDPNGQAACVTPNGVPAFESRAMSRDNVLGDVYALRAYLETRQGDEEAAARDLLHAIALYPESPQASNNFAWMIATKTFPGRERYLDPAVSEALRAVSLQRSATHLDTLACVYAARGDFAEAETAEKEAINLDAEKRYRKRLSGFHNSSDCTSEKD